MWLVTAAAWELGRLLYLAKQPPVQAALYNWKRRHAKADKLSNSKIQWLHLGFRKQTAPRMPSNGIEWFPPTSTPAHPSCAAVPFSILFQDSESSCGITWVGGFLKSIHNGSNCLWTRVQYRPRLKSDHSRDAAHTDRLTGDLRLRRARAVFSSGRQLSAVGPTYCGWIRSIGSA